MIIVWRGAGLLVFLTALGGFVLTQLTLNWATGNASFYETHGWTKLVGGAVSALLTSALVRALGRWRRRRAAADPTAGTPPRGGWADALFVIPARVWLWTLLGFGALAAAVP